MPTATEEWAGRPRAPEVLAQAWIVTVRQWTSWAERDACQSSAAMTRGAKWEKVLAAVVQNSRRIREASSIEDTLAVTSVVSDEILRIVAERALTCLEGSEWADIIEGADHDGPD
jgi:hypothetical protein